MPSETRGSFGVAERGWQAAKAQNTLATSPGLCALFLPHQVVGCKVSSIMQSITLIRLDHSNCPSPSGGRNFFFPSRKVAFGLPYDAEY